MTRRRRRWETSRRRSGRMRSGSRSEVWGAHGRRAHDTDARDTTHSLLAPRRCRSQRAEEHCRAPHRHRAGDRGAGQPLHGLRGDGHGHQCGGGGDEGRAGDACVVAEAPHGALRTRMPHSRMTLASRVCMRRDGAGGEDRRTRGGGRGARHVTRAARGRAGELRESDRGGGQLWCTLQQQQQQQQCDVRITHTQTCAPYQPRRASRRRRCSPARRSRNRGRIGAWCSRARASTVRAPAAPRATQPSVAQPLVILACGARAFALESCFRIWCHCCCLLLLLLLRALRRCARSRHVGAML